MDAGEMLSKTVPINTPRSLEAVYYPDCYPKDYATFACMAIYFEHVHFVSPSDDVSSTEGYTQFLKDHTEKGFRIGVIGDTSSPETRRQIDRAELFYGFVANSRVLLGEVVSYHPCLLTAEFNNVVNQLLHGGVAADDLRTFLTGQSSEQRAIQAFAREHPDLDDDTLVRLLPTARNLAASKGWVAISDVPALPAPVVRPLTRSSSDLAAAVAQELLQLSLPRPAWTTPERILEIRLEMNDELTAFRTMARRLASDLRGLIGDSPDYARVREEAKFLAETKVEPHMAEIIRRVKLERGKLWRQVFGKAMKWCSLTLASYMDPTGAALLKVIKEAGGDTAELLGQAHGITVAGDPGLSLLLRLGEAGKGEA